MKNRTNRPHDKPADLLSVPALELTPARSKYSASSRRPLTASAAPSTALHARRFVDGARDVFNSAATWIACPRSMWRLLMYKYDRPAVHRQIEDAIILGIVLGVIGAAAFEIWIAFF